MKDDVSVDALGREDEVHHLPQRKLKVHLLERKEPAQISLERGGRVAAVRSSRGSPQRDAIQIWAFVGIHVVRLCSDQGSALLIEMHRVY